jgi:hypothetical protein
MPEKGDYVTFRSPNGKDWSVVLETIDAKQPQRVRFTIVGGLSKGTVHIWETNSQRTFEHVSDVPVRSGAFDYTFDPDSLYSLTTTTGQGKGTATPAPAEPFPMSYRDDFEATADGRSPRFLADQDGAFEVHPCVGRPGKCLEQMITERPIPWGPLPDPWTLAGDASWTDYQVDADVRTEAEGSAMILGRIDSADVFRDGEARLPSGYTLRLHGDGVWELLSTGYGQVARTLAQGKIAAAAGEWHHLRLVFHGQQIRASVDEQAVAQVEDSSHQHGMFAIGSDWNPTQFDKLAVTQQ